MTVQRASVAPHGPNAALASSRTCYPVPIYVSDNESPCHQIALATPCQYSTLWEDYLQCLEDQLNPAVFLDRQQCNNFRASRNDDRNYCSGGGIHV